MQGQTPSERKPSSASPKSRQPPIEVSLAQLMGVSGEEELAHFGARLDFDPSWLKRVLPVLAQSGGEAHQSMAEELIANLMPSAHQPDEWAAWAAASFGGALTLPKDLPAKPYPDSGRLSKVSHDAMRRATAANAKAERLEAEAAECRAKAAAEVDFVRRTAAWSLLLMLRRHLSPIFALGPSWWVLAAVAHDAHLVSELDTYGSDKVFREGLYRAISGYIESYRMGHPKAPARRPSSVYRYAASWPVGEVAERLRALQPVASREAEPDGSGKVSDVMVKEPNPAVTEASQLDLDLVDLAVSPVAIPGDEASVQGSKTADAEQVPTDLSEAGADIDGGSQESERADATWFGITPDNQQAR